MKMIPPIVYNFRSRAEEKVFDALRKCGMPGIDMAFHSLNVHEHQYKKWCELDFVLLGRDGVFVLEIKGGHVACHDGIWTFTSRFGEEHRRSEGPFDQARSGMYALRKLISEEFGEPLTRNICFGWGVVFPDFKADVRSVEFPGEVVLDGPDFATLSTLEPYLTRLISHWRAKEARPTVLEGNTIARLSAFLRPSFEWAPSLARTVNDLVAMQVRMTDEQYHLIDSIAEAPRIICQGGAGTGKSFVAAEVARREATAGRSATLVCRGSVFAAFLRNRLRDIAVTVLDYEEARRHVARGGKRGQVLIVDEGQDLLEIEALDILGSLVEGGLEQGTWRFFMDSNNQGGLLGQPQDEALAYLQSCGATPLRLRRNCRNTEQIAVQTMAMTGADIGRTITEGKGQKVNYAYVSNPQDTARSLSRQLGDWVDGGAAYGEITILTPDPKSSLTLQHLKDHWTRAIVEVTEANAGTWPANRLTVSSIVGFKGLENRYVAVVDLDGFDGGRKSIAELYVAMTRSNAILWLAIPDSCRKVLDELRQVNMLAMCTSGGM